MKTLALLLALLAAYALVGANDRAADARAEFLRMADEDCLTLKPGEKVVIVSDGKQMRCRIYTNASPGMAASVVSSTVLEIPL